MTTLDEDTRHSNRNEQARNRAADQLEPAMVQLFPKLLAKWLEVDEDELPSARDSIKESIRSRQRREERKNQTVMEVIKWAVGLALGGLGTWLATHQGGGK